MKLPDAFEKMKGTWTGTMLRLGSAGAVEQSVQIRIDCEFIERDGGTFLKQTNTTTDADGNVTVVEVGGPVDDEGRLHLDTETVSGLVQDVSGCVFAEWTYKNDRAVRCWELTTFMSKTNRVRTWHHSRSGVVEGVSVFYEHRAAPA